MFASSAATAFAALGLTRLLDVTLIGALQPVVIIALAVMFLGEHVDRGIVTRAAVAVAGTVLVAIAGSTGGDWSLAGELLAILSLFLSVGWYLYGRVLSGALSARPLRLHARRPHRGRDHDHSDRVDRARQSAPLAGRVRLRGRDDGRRDQRGRRSWSGRIVSSRPPISAPFLLAQPPMVALAAWICFGESPGVVGIVGCCVVVGALFGMVRDPAVTRVEDEHPTRSRPTDRLRRCCTGRWLS